MVAFLVVIEADEVQILYPVPKNGLTEMHDVFGNLSEKDREPLERTNLVTFFVKNRVFGYVTV